MPRDKKINMETPSFFASFSNEEIFQHWDNSNTLLELAQHLGFNDSKGLRRCDYEYIDLIRNRKNWKLPGGGWHKERARAEYVKNLSKEDLTAILETAGITKVSHLALHFLLSSKHGRKHVREAVLAHGISVKNELHKGIHGVSSEPLYWPASFYKKRVGDKPSVCPVCGFKTVTSKQMELHHPTDIDSGPKNKRNPIYYKAKGIKTMCANCHSLEHRTGERLLNMCGQGTRGHISTKSLKYPNPTDIFTKNCSETYRLQKNYYLKWHLKGGEDYKCQLCGVSHWGKDQKLLSLELHHIDGDQQNSLISNLRLLCPNCHRLF